MSNVTDPEEDKLVYDTGDTAWLLASSALVMFQTFGLAIFYGSLVHPKHRGNTLLETVFTIALVPIQWALFGFSFAFANNGSSMFGTFQYAGLKDIGNWRDFSARRDTNAPTIPASVFVSYQMTFAVLTAGLLTGSLTGKIRMSSLVIFIGLWTTIVYDPIAHWVWSVNGWIHDLGSLDFAGGSVVHFSSGFSALASTIVLYMDGRKKSPVMDIPNQTENLLGAGILWFGWFGFNGGSALASNQIAGVAFLNTLLCPASTMFFWMLCELIYVRIRTGKPGCSLEGPLFGAVCGLVVITPGAGFIEPGFAVVIGAYSGPLCFLILWGWKALARKFGIFDDSLYVFVSHGLGGVIGSFTTGLFANPSINPGIEGGAFYGNGIQVPKQLADIAATAAWSFCVTAILMLTLKFTLGLKPDDHPQDAEPEPAPQSQPVSPRPDTSTGVLRKQPTLGELFNREQA